MKKYILMMLGLVFAGASFDVDALTYREAAEKDWAIVDKWFPDRAASNALALYGHYDRYLSSAVRVDGQNSVMEDEVSCPRIEELSDILEKFDLLFKNESLEELHGRDFVQMVGQSLLWVSGRASLRRSDSGEVSRYFDLKMAELLIGFIDKARDLKLFLDGRGRPVLFKSLFDKYCKNMNGSDSRLKKWEDPYEQACQLSPSEQMEKDAMDSYRDVAYRVQLEVLGIQEPDVPDMASEDIRCYKGKDGGIQRMPPDVFLSTIPKSPFSRVVA